MQTAVAAPVPRRYLSVPEAASYARVSVRQVKRALASGAVPRFKVGRRTITTIEAVDRWITGSAGAA